VLHARSHSVPGPDSWCESVHPFPNRRIVDRTDAVGKHVCSDLFDRQRPRSESQRLNAMLDSMQAVYIQALGCNNFPDNRPVPLKE
jgi:hypothetical protein